MLIGIDTGGTFTDAVVFDEEDGVRAAAKARTSRPDLSGGIAEALDAVLTEAGTDPADVSLVSLSTTLATNALVEGVGGRIALVFIGFSEADLDRGGLRDALGDSPVILVDGGHDSMGTEAMALDLDQAMAEARTLDVDAFAVAAQFSVRNPDHEVRVRDALLELGRPVACGHELSAKLNGPKRALTCVLNARLISLITDLCHAAETILHERGIGAPLMLVRGDGSLVTAAFAKARPIETILSGPAASIIGAGHLTGATDVIVSDIGGTTTDIGILTAGRPAVSVEGATVGGHRTMVEAVDMVTHGLGGDSEVGIDARSHPPTLTIGPRRILPLAQLAVEEPDLVHRTLDGRGYPYRDHHTRFVAPVAGGNRPATTVEPGSREAGVIERVGDGWKPLDQVVTSNLDASALRALVGRGVLRLAGFTPTDAAHVLGHFDAPTPRDAGDPADPTVRSASVAAGDRDASAKAAALLATTGDSRGEAVRPDAKALAQWVFDTLVRRSSEAVLAAILQRDGFDPTLATSSLAAASIDGHRGATAVTIGADLPLVGLGASAATYYPTVADLLRTEGVTPPHAGVANAIGAVVGRVRISRQATLSQPSKGQYRVHLPGIDDVGDLEPAIRAADAELRRLVAVEAAEAGADQISLETDVATTMAMVEGKDVFVEGTVTVVGSGRPRLGPARDDLGEDDHGPLR